MLRITVNDRPQIITFRLEGRLAGPWVRELGMCWLGTAGRRGEPNLCVDLTAVTFIDAAGEAILAAMHRQGAEFIAADCVTKAVVAEITQAPRSRRRACESESRLNETELQHDDIHRGGIDNEGDRLEQHP
jgi:hypothetical protein